MSCYVFVLGLIVFVYLVVVLFVVFLLSGCYVCFLLAFWYGFFGGLVSFCGVVYVGGVLSLRVGWWLFKVVGCL